MNSIKTSMASSRKKKKRNGVERRINRSEEILLGDKKAKAVSARTGTVNPFYAQAKMYVEKRNDFRSLGEDILSSLKPIGSGVNEFDMDDYYHSADFAAQFERFCEMMDQIESAKNEIVDMPPPPGANQLYGRVAQGETIVDLGSGEKGKTSDRAQHLKVKENDIIYGDDALDALDASDGAVFTSRNALTQFDSETIKCVEQQDGIHVVPDLKELELLGCVKNNGDGTYDAGKWKDYDHGFDGVPIKPGYLGYNTYSDETVDVEFDEEVQADGYTFPTKTYPDYSDFDIRTQDISPKVDGEMYCLQLRNGKALLLNRSGKGFKGKDISRYKFASMKLYLEKVDRVFVLLRVENYRNYIPFHGTKMLRKFVRKKNVRIRINGVRYHLRAPLDYGKDEYRYYDPKKKDLVRLKIPIDGVIIRTDKCDYYRKNKWTIDLDRQTYKELGQTIEDMGIVFEGEPCYEGRVCEYVYTSPEEGRMVLTHQRCREDKLDSNSIKDFVNNVVCSVREFREDVSYSPSYTVQFGNEIFE